MNLSKKYYTATRKGNLRSLLLACAIIAVAAATHAQQKVPALHASLKNVPANIISSADSTRSLVQLAKELEKIVALPAEIKSENVGIMVRSVESGKLIYQLNPHKGLTPASTTKLVTAYTALRELGPDYKIPTVVLADAKPKNGVIAGNMYIKGYGDPFLTITEIDGLIDKIIQAGVKTINGNIIGDGTYFDTKYERISYSGDKDVVVDLPPVAALCIERNTFSVVVSSPRTAGQKCNVQTFPRSSGFEIVNEATSYAPAKKKARKKKKAKKAKKRSGLYSPYSTEDNAVRFGDELLPAPPEPAESAGLNVTVSVNEQGKQVIKITGKLAVNKTASYNYEVKNPPLVVAGMFYDRLKTRGVKISGTIAADTAAIKAKQIATHTRPLVDVLSPMMKNSNNYLAECVFKMIGASVVAGNETAKGSVERIKKNMEHSEIPFANCVIYDGSGLSRRNLLTAETLTEILCRAHDEEVIFKALYSVLSVAGQDGTLRKRMKGSLAEKNARGKTGTLRNVSALTGYVISADNELFAFTALMNGFQHGSYKAVQDKIAMHLSEFSYNRVTPVNELEPK